MLEVLRVRGDRGIRILLEFLERGSEAGHVFPDFWARLGVALIGSRREIVAVGVGDSAHRDEHALGDAGVEGDFFL